MPSPEERDKRERAKREERERVKKEKDERKLKLEAKKELYRQQIFEYYDMEYARLCSERLTKQNNKRKLEF